MNVSSAVWWRRSARHGGRAAQPTRLRRSRVRTYAGRGETKTVQHGPSWSFGKDAAP